MIYHKSNFFSGNDTRMKSLAKENSLHISYNGEIPIKRDKLKDLLHLTQFLVKLEAKTFFQNLTTNGDHGEEDVESIDDPPIDWV